MTDQPAATRPTGAEIGPSQQRWRDERRYLNQHRHELTQALAHLYPADWQVAGTPCLARPEWCPADPVPLEDVPLTWRPGPLGTEVDLMAPTGSEAVRPWRDDGQRFASYAEAMAALDPPRVLQNRTCYRLLEAAAGPALAFGPNRYFDLINLSEAVAHETAQQVLRQPEATLELANLPLRAAIGDPRELARRSAPTGIGTLILRRDRDAGTAQMFLHWRDPARVAVNGGLYQVAPAGMFQPSDEAGWNLANDLDLWRAIAREVSEELLNTSEDYGSDQAPIDYGRWPFFAALTAARQAGTLRGYWLGVGVDVLTLDVDLLTVLVFDAALFDAEFGGLVVANDEGYLLKSPAQPGSGGDGDVGLEFTAETVERFARTEAMQPAGAALLTLAWQHREVLLNG
ncbi:MAG TPA: hypothetical protein VGI00_17110 [Streptosporangiaceae bacterium]|jgi:hypothetical protein